MVMIQLLESPIFGLIILPILIFSARVIDVTLGTLRIVFISQGRKNIAPLVGFFEMFIWILAAGQIFSNLTNILYYLAYAGGFAMGNYVGLVIEEKLSLGLISIHLIIKDDPELLAKRLKERGFGLTILTAEGVKGNVKLVVLVVKRKNKAKILNIIKETTPNAFISIESVQSVKGGDFPTYGKTRWNLFLRRKG